MKKFVYSFILILSMAVFVSCSTDSVLDPIVEPNTNTDNEIETELVPMEEVVLNIGKNTSSSRYVYMPRQGGGFDIEWKLGDKISLLYNKQDVSETVWKAVNLELVESEDGETLAFKGKVPANYTGEYVGVYPAMDPTSDGEQPYNVHAGKVYRDIEDGKSAIVQYFEDKISITPQLQVNDNDIRHIDALDYSVTNCSFKCVDTSKGKMMKTEEVDRILFKHVFAYAKMTISKSKLPRGAYPIGVSLAGYWGVENNDTVEYALRLQGKFEGDKLTFWMVIPEGEVAAGGQLKFTVYAVPMREEFTLTLANGHKATSGLSKDETTVYVYNIDTWTPKRVRSLFYAWGNLDGYDSRVDPHVFTNNNCGFYRKDANSVNTYLPGFTSAKTDIKDGEKSFAGLYINTPMNIGPNESDPANIGQPMGIGDPAAYYSNGLLHTPTKSEWEELIALAGTHAYGNPTKYNGCGQGELANRANGHDTDCWVAEDKNGQPIMNVAGLYKGDSNIENSARKLYAWRIYPRWAKELSDPFIKLVITGCNYYGGWGGYADTRYWASTMDGANNGYSILLNKGSIAEQVTSQDKHNGYLIVGITDINDFISPTHPNPCKLWDMWHPNN